MTALGATMGAARLTSPWRFQDMDRDRTKYPASTMPLAYRAGDAEQPLPAQELYGDLGEYVKRYVPWALQCGARAKPLLAVYWEERWEQNLEDLRRELHVQAFK
jgi:hypothetical protein